MPPAGSNPAARERAHVKWAARYNRQGDTQKALAHFGRALEYRSGFGVGDLAPLATSIANVGAGAAGALGSAAIAAGMHALFNRPAAPAQPGFTIGSSNITGGSTANLTDFMAGAELTASAASAASSRGISELALFHAADELESALALVCADEKTHRAADALLTKIRHGSLVPSRGTQDEVRRLIEELKRSSAWQFTEAVQLHHTAASSIYVCFNRDIDEGKKTKATDALKAVVERLSGGTLDAVGRRVNVFVTDISKLSKSKSEECKRDGTIGLYIPRIWNQPAECEFGSHLPGSIVIDHLVLDPARVFVHELTHVIHVERANEPSVKDAERGLNYALSVFSNIVGTCLRDRRAAEIRNRRPAEPDGDPCNTHARSSMAEFIAKLGEWYIVPDHLEPVRHKQILSFIHGEDINSDDDEQAAVQERAARVALLTSSIKVILAVT